MPPPGRNDIDAIILAIDLAPAEAIETPDDAANDASPFISNSTDPATQPPSHPATQQGYTVADAVGVATRCRSQSYQSVSPSPVVADTWKIRI